MRMKYFMFLLDEALCTALVKPFSVRWKPVFQASFVFAATATMRGGKYEGQFIHTRWKDITLRFIRVS